MSSTLDILLKLYKQASTSRNKTAAVVKLSLLLPAKEQSDHNSCSQVEYYKATTLLSIFLGFTIVVIINGAVLFG